MTGNIISPQGPPVGLIGVGLVGTALAERLLAAGFQVTGYDTDPAQLEALRKLGGRPAASPQEAAAAPRLLLSLPTSSTGAQVLSQIEPHLAPGAIVLDTTTGDPAEIASFGARLHSRGVHYLDSTVGGSSRLVREGTAIYLCGGERQAFNACHDLFQAFGGRAFHVGPCGAGARMKLVLNLVLGLNRAVLAEGLAYAIAEGIDPAAALEILKAGPAYSRAMDAKGQKMLARDYSVEARLSQHLKDVRLILQTGAQNGARLPLSAVHRQLLEQAESAGFGAADNSAIFEAFTQDHPE
ncbi:MAG: NAD(P)-dependent oxidoreductase [Acidobacteria bacterium]|nr:NAD(P)-dependent oxidoreductase [Acidobacteriota bacterium]